MEARRTSPALNNPFQLQARVQGVTVEPARSSCPSVDRRRADPGDLDADQHLRSGRGHAARAARWAACRTERPTIAEGGPTRSTGRRCPRGPPAFDRRGSATRADLGADLDLYVYRRHHRGRPGRRRRLGGGGLADQPARPATYRVVVDAYAVDGPRHQHRLRLPRRRSRPAALGTLTGPGRPRCPGARRQPATITGTVTALAAPAAGGSSVGELADRHQRGRGRRPRHVAIGAVN